MSRGKNIAVIGSMAEDTATVRLDFSEQTAPVKEVLRKIHGSKIAVTSVGWSYDGYGLVLDKMGLHPGSTSNISEKELAVLIGISLPSDEPSGSSVGGGGFNAAVMAARMGLSPTLYTGVGSCGGVLSIRAKNLMSEAQRNGVNIHPIKKDGLESGASIVLVYEVDGKEDRTIFVYRGASRLSIDDVRQLPLHTADGMIVTNLGNPETTTYLMKMLSPKVPALFISSKTDMHYMDQHVAEITKTSARQLRWATFVMNKEEWNTASPGWAKDYSPIQEVLIDETSLLVVTNGKKDGQYYHGSERSNFFVAPDRMKFVSSTGAGDAFAAALFLGMNFRGMDLRRTLLFALAISARVVASPTSTGGIPQFWTAWRTPDRYAKLWYGRRKLPRWMTREMR